MLITCRKVGDKLFIGKDVIIKFIEPFFMDEEDNFIFFKEGEEFLFKNLGEDIKLFIRYENGNFYFKIHILNKTYKLKLTQFIKLCIDAPKDISILGFSKKGWEGKSKLSLNELDELRQKAKRMDGFSASGKDVINTLDDQERKK